VDTTDAFKESWPAFFNVAIYFAVNSNFFSPEPKNELATIEPLQY
jgi:hypothetical protein